MKKNFDIFPAYSHKIIPEEIEYLNPDRKKSRKVVHKTKILFIRLMQIAKKHKLGSEFEEKMLKATYELGKCSSDNKRLISRVFNKAVKYKKQILLMV